MKNLVALLMLAVSGAALSEAAPVTETDFNHQLVRSGYVHTPLPLDYANSLEAEMRKHPVEAEMAVDMTRGWTNEGIGTLTLHPDSNSVTIAYPTSTGRRAVGPEGDRDYAVYGRAAVRLTLGGIDVSDYDRIVFDIRPTCPGMRVVNMNLAFNNHGPRREGFNNPTGNHLINLTNGRRNDCILEIADLQRDNLESIAFDVSLNGRDITTGDSARYEISNIRFQRTGRAEKVSGWTPAPDKMAYSMTGYAADGRKTAVVAPELTGPFTIVDAESGREVLKGTITPRTTTTGAFGEIDFSAVTAPGRYVISTAGGDSRPFAIGDAGIWDNSQWRVVNYIFGQRCGHEVPGIHGKCHTDLFAVHDGVKIPYSGGWHDAGDLSQQTLQTAETAYALLCASQASRDRNPLLSARLAEEARWGLDHEVRSRFGDGYRASSMGLLIWQDGKHDSFDDITSVRVQNVALDNYMHAAFEAAAAMTLADDPAYTDYLARIARDDFDFAEAEFEKTGLGGWISIMEHTYNTSMSQMMATVSWAASQMYRLTGEERYARRAAEAMDYVLACQADGPDPLLSGFFYRDDTRRVPVHYIHQSRDQIYMQALDALCSTQPGHPDRGRWLGAVRSWGDHVKALMAYTAPYGMIPSGVYRDDEYLDSDSFTRLHLFAPDNATELFKAQFAEGEPVAEHYALRRFPIWFSIFNGNTAIHLSTGIGAAIAGRLLDDPELTDIAREQLYWTVGKNPFAQSLIYGEGHRYPMMNSFSSGEITGEMPVGIRSLDNADIPYWPQINNACYKEVWVTSAGKWLSLLAELGR